jgi:hypothetical protein
MSPEAAAVLETVARLIAAGLDSKTALKVARHPTGGPVIIGPGIVISVFPVSAELGEAIAS